MSKMNIQMMRQILKIYIVEIWLEIWLSHFEKINSKFKDNIIKLYSNLQEDEVKKNIITMLKNIILN